jgi:hypothetical protein
VYERTKWRPPEAEISKWWSECDRSTIEVCWRHAGPTRRSSRNDKADPSAFQNSTEMQNALFRCKMRRPFCALHPMQRKGFAKAERVVWMDRRLSSSTSRTGPSTKATQISPDKTTSFKTWARLFSTTPSKDITTAFSHTVKQAQENPTL